MPFAPSRLRSRSAGLVVLAALMFPRPPLATAEADPFADLPLPVSRPEPPAEQGRIDATLKRELFSQFVASHVGGEDGDVSSRQSVGIEGYARFSSRTATIAAVDVQVRLVRRDNPIDVADDMDATAHDGWTVELHNCYLDLYNVLNPLLSEPGRADNVGRFNLRIGKFYLPFGLNLQTDTHGTVLQLSNEQDFGFERDWYAGFWGSIDRDFTYDCYYLLGSGSDPEFHGQTGLVGARLSLGNAWRVERGIEAGVAVMSGERLVDDPSGERIVRTFRIGPDARWTHAAPQGTGSLTGEVAVGDDDGERVTMQLYQADYLHRSRRWGLASQYRRYDLAGSGALASIIGQATWYFRNDVGGAFLHWVSCAVERQVANDAGPEDTRATIQYYRYW